MTARLCRRFGEEPKCSAPECVKGGSGENVVRMQRWFPDWRRSRAVIVQSFFYAGVGFTCNCPPTAFKTFIIVPNCGLAPSDKALYKLGLLSPVSSAILVIPI